MKCHFGKHKGKELGEIPGGYLKWAVENIDPIPLPKYRYKEDGVTPLTAEEVKAVEVANREFLSAAEDELVRREEEKDEQV